ncbi:MAG: peroxide stress protein YaaA [Flavobacteriales bacterium]|nr:peroxide stress protein YaaA [Flavobacteriales bacterium]
MLAVISPAKLIKEDVRYPKLLHSQPVLLDRAEELVLKLKKVSAKKLCELMDTSTDLGELNKRRYAEWHLPFTTANAIQAMLMFRGDVYRGLNADDFTKDEFAFAQNHLRILSGIYGFLRPMDLVQPYRLMMGTPFSPSSKIKNLYQFWGDDISEFLGSEMKKDEALINLASAEYFKAVRLKSLNRKVITCEFKELKNGKYIAVMTFAKLARGYMARFIIKNKIDKPEYLKAFDTNGYVFNPKMSSEDLFLFTR